MRRQCENCGNYLTEADRACPVCGIPASFPPEKVKAASDEFDSLVRSSNPSVKKQRYVTLSTVVIAVLSIALLLVTLSTCLGSSKLCSKPMNYNKDLGYYNYNDKTYYNQGGSWYEYDPALGWILADPSDDFLDHYDNYYEGQINNGSSDVSDFRDSEYYDPNAGLTEQDGDMWNRDNDRNHQEYSNLDYDMDDDW